MTVLVCLFWDVFSLEDSSPFAETAGEVGRNKNGPCWHSIWGRIGCAKAGYVCFASVLCSFLAALGLGLLWTQSFGGVWGGNMCALGVGDRATGSAVQLWKEHGMNWGRTRSWVQGMTCSWATCVTAWISASLAFIIAQTGPFWLLFDGAMTPEQGAGCPIGDLGGCDSSIKPRGPGGSRPEPRTAAAPHAVPQLALAII